MRSTWWAKCTVQRLAVALLVEDVEEDVRRAAAAVLGEDHRRPDAPAAAAGRPSSRTRSSDPATGSSPANDALRTTRDRCSRQRRAVVGQVHRIQVNRRALKIVQIAGRDVAKQEHGGGRPAPAQRRWRCHGACRVCDQRANKLAEGRSAVTVALGDDRAVVDDGDGRAAWRDRAGVFARHPVQDPRQRVHGRRGACRAAAGSRAPSAGSACGSGS